MTKGLWWLHSTVVLLSLQLETGLSKPFSFQNIGPPRLDQCDTHPHRILATKSYELFQDVGCVEDPSFHAMNLGDYTSNYSKDKEFRVRGRFKCFRSDACFRAVLDGVFTTDDIVEILTGPANKQPLTVLEKIKEKFHHYFGIRNIKDHFSRRTSYNADSDFSGIGFKGNFSGLHSDFLSNDLYLYTAIIYLNTYGKDFVGGELGLIDAFRHTGPKIYDVELAAGLIIEPAVGRLVLFSSGAENMHTVLPVVSGTRGVVQIWFTCEGIRELCIPSGKDETFTVECIGVEDV